MKTSPTPSQTPSEAADSPFTRRRMLVACLGSGAALAGCGGGAADGVAVGRDTVQHRGIDSGGTGSPMMSFMVAVVDSVTPLVAGGVRYDSDGTRWCDADDRTLTADDVAPGMTGWIDGSTQSAATLQARARALQLRIGEQVLGPVQAVDAALGRITVLGQTVVVTAGTVWGDGLSSGPGSGLGGLRQGRVLRVFGELDTTGGRVLATRIDAADAPAAWVLRGQLSRLDRGSGQLVVAGVALQAGPDVTLPIDLSPGDLLRVRLAPGSGTVLSLRGDAPPLPDSVEAEIEGRITAVESAQRFAVDGVWVDASALAVAVLPQTGLHAEVHGHSQGGVLVASSVKIEPPEPIELEGKLQSVDLIGRSLVLRGRVVRWTDATVFLGGPSTLLVAGRKAAIKGTLADDGLSLQAQKIHVER